MPDTQTLTVVCAWCSRVLSRHGGGQVSHGICDDCLPALLRQIDALRPDPVIAHGHGGQLSLN